MPCSSIIRSTWGPLCGLTVGQLRILIQRYNAQAD